MDVRSSKLKAALDLAGEQHGAIGAGQLAAAGVSRKVRGNAVAAGMLIEVAATAYVVARSADTWHRRLQTGLLALGVKRLGQPRGCGAPARPRRDAGRAGRRVHDNPGRRGVQLRHGRLSIVMS